MVTGWRRAFCTSIREEKEHVALPVKQHDHDSTIQSPRVRSKFGLFSNPSTPRLQSQPVSSPNLHCRTTVSTSIPTSSIPNSPKIQCTNTTTSTLKSHRLFQFSTPSSPKSPSNFSFFKARFSLSRGKCGICMQSVKASQGKASFTSECSHIFHFPCIAAHVKQNILLCPTCNTSWKELPLLAICSDTRFNSRLITEKSRASNSTRDVKTKSPTLYDDDEHIMSPTPVVRFFNPIPESDENEEGPENYSDHNSTVEIQGFFSNGSSPRTLPFRSNIELRLSPEAAIVAVTKGGFV